MASILRQFIILHQFMDDPATVRDFMPYECNMLNALETAFREPYREGCGVLDEVTPRYWEFSFTRDGRDQRLRITMTDVMLETNNNKPKPSGRSISAPRFK